jgi:purine-nucleoside phosphorylase
MKRLGINTLILTNAAGGLNPNWNVGDIMLIADHILLVGMAGVNPLRGPNLDEFGPRFPATNRTYSRELRTLAHAVAQEQGLTLRQGVYLALSGPQFESPAEIRMMRAWGADAVGMSTATEALVARHADMDVLAFSTVTNICVAELDAGVEPSHEEVIDSGRLIVPRLTNLLLGVLARLAQPAP